MMDQTIVHGKNFSTGKENTLIIFSHFINKMEVRVALEILVYLMFKQTGLRLQIPTISMILSPWKRLIRS